MYEWVSNCTVTNGMVNVGEAYDQYMQYVTVGTGQATTGQFYAPQQIQYVTSSATSSVTCGSQQVDSYYHWHMQRAREMMWGYPQAAREATQVAASRADQLLMSFLSDSQADQYKRDNRFDLVINGRTYRINKGRAGNIQLIENGKPVAKYCAHPEIWTPDGDTLLAQMLALQTDEAAFLKVANRTALV